MTRFYLRRKAGPRETLGALAAAVSVGAVSFYFVRLLLAREGIEREAPRRLPKTGTDVSTAPDTEH